MILSGRLLFSFRQFEGNIHKKNNNQNKGCGYLDISIYIPKIVHFSNFLSNQTVISKNTIPKVISNINTKVAYKLLGRIILGPINAIANQAAEIFIDRPEKALRYGWYFFLAI